MHMKNLTLITALGLLAGLSALQGCSTAPKELVPLDGDAPVMISPGARIWAENCTRCHNLRPPDSLSDAQWEVALHHMRVRAGLTGAEYRAILRFIKSGF